MLPLLHNTSLTSHLSAWGSVCLCLSDLAGIHKLLAVAFTATCTDHICMNNRVFMICINMCVCMYEFPPRLKQKML